MKRCIILFLVLIHGIAVTAGTDEEIFARANSAYTSRNYSEAIKLYSKIRPGTDAEYVNVLYNLGCAYYDSGDIAKAVLALKRAAFIEPQNPNVSKALAMIEKKEHLQVTRSGFPDKYIFSFSLNSLLMLSSVLLLIITAVTVFRITKAGRRRKKAVRTALAVLCPLLLIILSAAKVQFGRINEAVVMQKETAVKESPFNGAEETVQLKAGEIVNIDEEYGTYYQISTRTGATGWVKKSELEKMSD